MARSLAYILDRQLPSLLHLVHELSEAGRDMGQLLSEIMGAVRELLISKVAPQEASLSLPEEWRAPLEELLARVRSLLHRAALEPTTCQDPVTLQFEDLSLDPDTREVFRGERAISLTRTEFALLELLMNNPRRVLSRTSILEDVWGYDFPTSGNALEVYIGYLRRKTEADGESRLIYTVRGVG